MKKSGFNLAVVCFLLLATAGSAMGSSIFGPKKYIRTTGPKDVYTENYAATPGPGLITILNGEENGENRVTSATITFNGVEIFSPNDFKKAVYLLEKTVTLAATNTIVIELASKPGTYLTFTQFQDAPTLTASVNPDTILVGQTATLSWGSTLADSVSIDQGIGNVALSGTLNVSPQATTVYTFTATGAGGTSTFPVTVTVIPPPTVSITASPDTVIIGNSCELAWTSEHADTVEIDNGIGPAALSGSLSVFPLETTTYTITATGPGGTASASVCVTVITLPVITLSAEPLEINAGESFVLAWSVSYADLVIGEQTTSTGSISEEIPSAGSNTLSPSRTTTYKITATGPGGTVTESLTVIVNVPPPTVTITADPSIITCGSQTILSWDATYADQCTITPDIGQVDVDGSTETTPQQTTTYTITAIGPGGTATADALVSVNALPPVVNFTANPADINFGESSILSWEVFLADSCEILPDIGSVDLSGTTTLSPSQTTTYTLTATGPGGITTKSITIRLPDVDLEPVYMDASNSSTDGQTLAITGFIDIEIKNNGTRPIDSSFLVTLFEDTNNNLNFDAGTDTVLGVKDIPAGLAAGASIGETIPVNGIVTFMDNRIFAYVDSDNALRENNEANNITHSMMDCEYHPPVGSFTPVVEWRWSESQVSPLYNKVTSLPVVANLTDDNNDRLINQHDIPDIVFNT